MDAIQLANAVINDRSTVEKRQESLEYFKNTGFWDSAVQQNLALIINEIKKPIYDGMGSFREILWAAAAEVLDFDIAQAIAEKELQNMN